MRLTGPGGGFNPFGSWEEFSSILNRSGFAWKDLIGQGKGAMDIRRYGSLLFPSAQIASSDPNALDDYEEGSWTPTLTFATPGDLAVVYSLRDGRYTKIGNRVLATYNVTTSTFTHTTASGSCQITGLAFTSASSFVQVGSGTWEGITKAGYTQINPYIAVSTASILFQGSGSGAAGSVVTTADMPTGGTVALHGAVVYWT